MNDRGGLLRGRTFVRICHGRVVARSGLQGAGGHGPDQIGWLQASFGPIWVRILPLQRPKGPIMPLHNLSIRMAAPIWEVICGYFTFVIKFVILEACFVTSAPISVTNG